MSRKHFIALAEMFAGELALVTTPAEAERVRGIILSTADICKRANTRFKRERFYAAAGLDESGQLSDDTIRRLTFAALAA